MQSYRVVVIRPDEPVNSRIKILKSGLTKAEAQAEKEFWSDVFCPEVYFDPVPILRIEPDSNKVE